ncbi:centriolar coiled-coil protein of 110 kDa-like isoform X2 [Littorina saxatilis]|uniref:centriolar coiled-coil protein of 110 kDa-like isoform X2 n=1 Tax=Littorina saxatilis TaxID=31220 RepID=UPI0038B4FA9C
MDPSEELASPAAMKELIQYFETHGRLLDRQDLSEESALQASRDVTSFVSCIRFNGVPILPPVMTNSRVDEVRQDRHNAVFKEKRLKARQRKHLMEVANQLVENTESREPSSGTRSGRAGSARLPIDRPPVLKPVVTSAWASIAASGGTESSVQSTESVSAMGASSVANTFATAEQGQEDFGLQTLDSMCSDFMSLEETLPTDFNGVPLTSVRQQKISHDLMRMSKILKVKDFNSTSGSDVSELPLSEYVGDSKSGESVRNGTTSALDNVSASFFHESQDTVVEVTPETTTENNTSGFVDHSMDGSPVETSSPGDGHFSGGGSDNTSGMSSANTTGTTDSHRSSRSSPRSLKNNTVHFASFVTEYIDTSASLSSENITVVKKKLPADQVAKNKQGGKEETASATNKEESLSEEGLLNNVSLAESDSPVTPTTNPSNLPFQQYAKVDPSSSDKENDAKQANKMSGSGTNSKSSQKSAVNVSHSGGGNSVTDSQGSSRSDGTVRTSGSSNSTLIEDAATAASRDSTNSLPLNIVESRDDDSSGKEKSKAAAGVPTRKPKKLPPEPPQETYQPPSRQLRVVNSKTAANQSGAATEGYRKGHVRRGSYTLSEPSPALVRSQATTQSGGDGETKNPQRKLNYEDEEDQTKLLNIRPQPVVPSEPESTGKAEHINKYLSQVQLISSEDVTASQVSMDSVHQSAASGQVQNSLSLMQSITLSQASVSSAAGGEAVQQFESLQHNLLHHQQKELEELFIQQRREQMALQAEIEEHNQRMKEQQEFLVSNAPENIKVQSQSNDGELSPDSNTGDQTNVKRFNFPTPKRTQINLHGQRIAGGAVSPGQLMLDTSVSSSSPKVRRPVLRSPVKFLPGRRNSGRVLVPPEAYEPEMRVKFEKLTAAGRGFLTRCLLQSDKVQELVKTIKDTREFAFSFQSETPIRKGNLSNQDRTLLERIVAQLQAALLDIHEIFFDTPVIEQMGLIEQTRLNTREKRLKSSTDESVRGSVPRISTATLKAQERRRRAQEAESTVFGASSARPRTAPASSNSPRSNVSVDLSGPLKRHYQFLLAKARKPAAMHAAHLAHQSHQHPQASGARPDTSRSEKARPQTAPERPTSARPKKPVSVPAASSNVFTSENAQSKLNIRVKQPSQQPTLPVSSKQTNKPSKTSSKSWR